MKISLGCSEYTDNWLGGQDTEVSGTWWLWKQHLKMKENDWWATLAWLWLPVDNFLAALKAQRGLRMSPFGAQHCLACLRINRQTNSFLSLWNDRLSGFAVFHSFLLHRSRSRWPCLAIRSRTTDWGGPWAMAGCCGAQVARLGKYCLLQKCLQKPHGWENHREN